MNTAETVAALTPYRSVVPGLDDALARLLGGASVDNAAAAGLLGGHLIVNDTLLAVYLALPGGFAMLEATPDGSMFSLYVPVLQIRRVALLESTTTTRLTIEIQADRSTLAGSLAADGTLAGDIRPAGYELVAMADAERVSLRSLQAALIAAVNG